MHRLERQVIPKLPIIISSFNFRPNFSCLFSSSFVRISVPLADVNIFTFSWLLSIHAVRSYPCGPDVLHAAIPPPLWGFPYKYISQISLARFSPAVSGASFSIFCSLSTLSVSLLRCPTLFFFAFIPKMPPHTVLHIQWLVLWSKYPFFLRWWNASRFSCAA